jgi:hypothetical protein
MSFNQPDVQPLISIARAVPNRHRPILGADRGLETAQMRWYPGDSDGLQRGFITMVSKGRMRRTAISYFALKRIASVWLLVLAVSCVPAETAFRPIPGKRGKEVTIAVPPPAAIPSAEAAGFDPTQLPALDAVTDPSILAAEFAQAGIGQPGTAPFDLPQSNLLLPTVPLTATTLLNPGPAALPYVFRGGSANDSLRAQLCLTAAIYYEAANEPDEGQRGVAQVVLNRVRHPAYPNTVCDVVYQGTERGDLLCQFSFACDGSMQRIPARESWARASRVARAALAGSVFAPVGNATHYHTHAVNPSWNQSMTRAAFVGNHVFFRWSGAAGLPSAFYARYTGREPNPGPRPHPIRAIPLPHAIQPDPAYAALQAALAKQTPVAMMPTGVPVQSAVPIQPQPTVTVAQDNRYVQGALPESQIRDEFRDSGQWIKR